MSTVKYKNDAIVITIPTTTPAALHEFFLRGLIIALRDQQGENEKQALTELLLALTPKEPSLEKAFSE